MLPCTAPRVRRCQTSRLCQQNAGRGWACDYRFWPPRWRTVTVHEDGHRAESSWVPVLWRLLHVQQHGADRVVTSRRPEAHGAAIVGRSRGHHIKKKLEWTTFARRKMSFIRNRKMSMQPWAPTLDQKLCLCSQEQSKNSGLAIILSATK